MLSEDIVTDARRAADDDATFGAMLALNAAHAIELSALTPESCDIC